MTKPWTWIEAGVVTLFWDHHNHEKLTLDGLVFVAVTMAICIECLVWMRNRREK